MRHPIAVIIVALAASSFPSSAGPNCGFGWFGSSCQYRCRCTQDKCEQDGSCESHVACTEGWFGPQCQYADLAFNTSLMRELTDGKDDTCLRSGNRVQVTLHKPYVFTWLRVYFSKEGCKHPLSVLFGQNSTEQTCSNKRYISEHQRTLDVYCDLDQTVQVVSLTGEDVQHMCSLYVSGGRNVALRQPTEESSTSSYNSTGTGSVNFTSDRSVDGNTGADLSGNHSDLTSTASDVNTSWTVHFLKPQKINRYVLYHKGGETHRLPQFILTSYDSLGQKVFQHSDLSPPVNISVYTVISSGVNAITAITRVSILTINQNEVTHMQEVEIYDSSCQTAQFGLECELTCRCDKNQPCFVSTGQCPNGCITGFTGATCSNICEIGTYGPGCNFICGSHCMKAQQTQRPACDPSNGSCLFGCSQGFSDPMCCTDTRDEYIFNLVVGMSVPVVLLGLLSTSLLAFFLKRKQTRKNTSVMELADSRKISQTSEGETLITESESDVTQAEETRKSGPDEEATGEATGEATATHSEDKTEVDAQPEDGLSPV